MAFSFTRGAREEVVRAKRVRDVNIRLVEVRELVENPQDLRMPDINELFPKTMPITFLDMPLPKARSPKARPSLIELIKSDKQANGITEESAGG